MRYTGRILVPAWLIVAGLGAAAVDGLGRALERRVERRPRLRWLPGALVLACAALVLVESWPRPAALTQPPSSPGLYAGIAADPGAHAVLHLPYWGRAHDAERMDRGLAAMTYDRPTVNGATGFDPALVDVLQDALRSFPSHVSRDALRELGVDRLVLHPPHLDSHVTRRMAWLEELDRREGAAVLAVLDVPPDRAEALRREVRDFEVGPEAPADAIDRETLTLTSPRNRWQLPNLVDGDPTTRWTQGRAQRPGELWFTIELPEPACVSAIWMDYREAPRDLPRGIRVTARATADTRFEPWLERRVHFPVGALIAAPREAVDRVSLPPRTVQALRVHTVGGSHARWGSVYELHLEACEREPD